MSFTDTLKRSLGFEETDSNSNGGSSFKDLVDNVRKPIEDRMRQQQNPRHSTSKPNPRNRPNPTTNAPPRQYRDFGDDYVITPNQSFYEIVLIRPKTIDDINYVVDQVIEEKNPVILDLSFLEKESEPNFRLAGDKIKQMRLKYNAQALLLEHSEDKNLILVSPKKVKVVNKG